MDLFQKDLQTCFLSNKEHTKFLGQLFWHKHHYPGLNEAETAKNEKEKGFDLSKFKLQGSGLKATQLQT